MNIKHKLFLIFIANIFTVCLTSELPKPYNSSEISQNAINEHRYLTEQEKEKMIQYFEKTERIFFNKQSIKELEEWQKFYTNESLNCLDEAYKFSIQFRSTVQPSSLRKPIVYPHNTCYEYEARVRAAKRTIDKKTKEERKNAKTKAKAEEALNKKMNCLRDSLMLYS
jgi:hypothetical protein